MTTRQHIKKRKMLLFSCVNGENIQHHNRTITYNINLLLLFHLKFIFFVSNKNNKSKAIISCKKQTKKKDYKKNIQ